MFVTSFNKVMSRDRFDLIWRYLHLQDNEVVPVDDERPDKLRGVLSALLFGVHVCFIHQFFP
jgi:hypothetical protein